jgi:hypothetical protein
LRVVHSTAKPAAAWCGHASSSSTLRASWQHVPRSPASHAMLDSPCVRADTTLHTPAARSGMSPSDDEYEFSLTQYMVVLDKPIGLTLAPDPLTGQVCACSDVDRAPTNAAVVQQQQQQLRRQARPRMLGQLGIWHVSKQQAKLTLVGCRVLCGCCPLLPPLPRRCMCSTSRRAWQQTRAGWCRCV